MTVSPNEFRSGMRQLAAAVNVVTSVHEGRRAGMTATAVTSLTADPPQLGVAVNRGNASYATMVASRVLAVNVLSHAQSETASRFAGADGSRGEERFANGPSAWGMLHTGAPVLLDCAASFDCELVKEVELSSHVLLIALVKAVRVEATTTPLLYMDGAWASLVRANKVDFEAYQGVVEHVAAAIDGALSAEERPRAQLSRFVRSFAEVNAARSDVLRDFFSHETFAPAERLDAINRRKREVEAKLRAVLARGAELGEFDIPDPGLAADSIIGMLNSIHRWSGTRSDMDPASVGAGFDDMIASMVGRRTA